MDNLKPCPFCGEQAIIDKDFCGCSNGDCHNVGYMYLGSEWNNRPVEDALLAKNESQAKEIAELKAKIEKYESSIKSWGIEPEEAHVFCGRIDLLIEKNVNLEAKNQLMRKALKMIMKSDQTTHCLLCHDCAQKALKGGE